MQNAQQTLMAKFMAFMGQQQQLQQAAVAPALTPVQQALDPLVLKAPVAPQQAAPVDPFGYATDLNAINGLVSKQAYASLLPAEQFTTALTDPAQLQAYINTAIQAGVSQALSASFRHANSVAEDRALGMSNKLPEMFAQFQTQQLFNADPLFSHPSMATTRDSLVASFKQANPTATPQAAYEYAKQHVQGISQVIATQQAASAPQTQQQLGLAQEAAAADF
jgi:hypothetical protein